MKNPPAAILCARRAPHLGTHDVLRPNETETASLFDLARAERFGSSLTLLTEIASKGFGKSAQERRDGDEGKIPSPNANK
jgi:hypothetical protein